LLPPRTLPIIVSTVRGRAFRIFLLALITVWFGVVVPLHPRGAIKLGGSACAGSNGSSCCHKDGPTDSPAKPKPAECAICHFLAALDLPPALGLDVPALGLVDELMLSAPIAPTMVAYLLPVSERGPPTA
jgi:hypothetical protein